MADEDYANIRDILRSLIGQRLMDISQHDREDLEERGEAFIEFFFENGDSIRIPVNEAGFQFVCDADDEEEEE